jgi:hypothetical protein
MNSHRQISVIAPEQMVSAFSVLVYSAPQQCLQASATNLDELRATLGDKKTDVILVYLVPESGFDEGKAAYEIIARIKATWPDVLCIAVIKYASQLAKAKESGADIALIDGVSAERLLAAFEGKLT